MSLAKVVTEIVDEMDMSKSPAIRSFARQLRRVVTAAEGTEPIPFTVQHANESPVKHEDILKAFGCDPSGPLKAEAKRLNRKADNEERGSPGMVEIVGGMVGDNPEVATWHPIDPTMPIGAKTAVGKCVYVLQKGEDGKRRLVFSEHDTKEVFGGGKK